MGSMLLNSDYARELEQSTAEFQLELELIVYGKDYSYIRNAFNERMSLRKKVKELENELTAYKNAALCDILNKDMQISELKIELETEQSKSNAYKSMLNAWETGQSIPKKIRKW